MQQNACHLVAGCSPPFANLVVHSPAERCFGPLSCEGAEQLIHVGVEGTSQLPRRRGRPKKSLGGVSVCFGGSDSGG